MRLFLPTREHRISLSYSFFFSLILILLLLLLCMFSTIHLIQQYWKIKEKKVKKKTWKIWTKKKKFWCWNTYELKNEDTLQNKRCDGKNGKCSWKQLLKTSCNQPKRQKKTLISFLLFFLSVYHFVSFFSFFFCSSFLWTVLVLL